MGIVGRLKIAVAMTNMLKVDREVGFCHNTLQNALRDVLKRCQSLICHKRNIEEKLCFVTIYKDLTVDDWKRVVFRNKMKTNCFGANGSIWWWVSDNESLLDHVEKQTMKQNGESMMLLSCMTTRGLREL